MSDNTWNQYPYTSSGEQSRYAGDIGTSSSLQFPIVDPALFLSASALQSSGPAEVQLTGPAEGSYLIDTADSENSSSNNGITSGECLGSGAEVPYPNYPARDPIGQYESSGRGPSLIVFCLYPGCQCAYRSRSGFNRHFQTVHNPALLDCPFPGCLRVGSKGISRKDNLREHLRSVHAEPIPKIRRGAGGV